MKRTIEVELKYEILDLKLLHQFLASLRFEDKRQVSDQYFDTKKGDLFQRGIFIRIRNYKKLDFKFNQEELLKNTSTGEHEHCDELSFSLPLNDFILPNLNKVNTLLGLVQLDIPDMDVYKRRNNLEGLVNIDKLRIRYHDDEFEYAVDTVQDLGTFLEIETVVDENADLTEIKMKMRERVKDLKVALVPTGYVELYLRQHNYELYKKGKYLIEGDK